MLTRKRILGMLGYIAAGYIFGMVLFPYIKTEWLTLLHRDEFIALEQQTNLLMESEYFKVFHYSEYMAQVYYVEKNHSSANLITFIKEDNEWKLYLWETIWSSSGSAGGWIWPIYL